MRGTGAQGGGQYRSDVFACLRARGCARLGRLRALMHARCLRALPGATRRARRCHRVSSAEPRAGRRVRR